MVHKVSTTLWYSGAVVEAILYTHTHTHTVTVCRQCVEGNTHLGMKLQVTVREKTHKLKNVNMWNVSGISHSRKLISDLTLE